MSRSLALSLRVVGETLAICIPTLTDSARGKLTKQASDRRLASWSKRVIDAARMRLDVRGAEHHDEGSTYVLMSNHQSHMDIPVLYFVFGGSVRMIAKIELFRVPIFGAAMREAGFVAVDRQNRHSAIANLAVAKRALDSGTSIWIAPEGTRSSTGELGAFKKGGFNLAFDTGSRILPVTIQGTREVLPPHGARMAQGRDVRVTIHEPLDPARYGADRRLAIERLMKDARAAIESAL